jgi:hypothetical protein
MEQGLARKKATRKELYDGANGIIRRTQDIVKLLMRQGYITQPPPEPQ